MENKYNLTLAVQTLVLLFNLDLFNVYFRMPSIATIHNLLSRFPCWWQKQFLAANWLTKWKGKQLLPKLKTMKYFWSYLSQKRDLSKHSLKKKVFLIFFYISIYYAWNFLFLNTYLYEKRFYFIQIKNRE